MVIIKYYKKSYLYDHVEIMVVICDQFDNIYYYYNFSNGFVIVLNHRFYR